MDKISKLINQAHTVNISLEVSYYNELIGYFKEAAVSDNENKLFKKRKTYHIERSSESIIRTLYNDARFSLALLSHEQLANALQVLQSYSYKKFYQNIKAFTSKFNRDETNEIHEISFIYSMRRHLICDIPNKGRITHPFLCGLSSELFMKNRYMDALADDIKKLLGEETENNEMNTKEKPNNIRKLSNVGEQLSDIVEEQNQHSITEVYYAKHYVLAFMFDYWMKGGNYKELLGQKKKIINIAETRLNGEFSSDRFYKVFNELADSNIDLENEKSLINLIGDHWKDVVINLSNEPEKMREHLKNGVNTHWGEERVKKG